MTKDESDKPQKFSPPPGAASALAMVPPGAAASAFSAFAKSSAFAKFLDANPEWREASAKWQEFCQNHAAVIKAAAEEPSVSLEDLRQIIEDPEGMQEFAEHVRSVEVPVEHKQVADDVLMLAYALMQKGEYPLTFSEAISAAGNAVGALYYKRQNPPKFTRPLSA